MSSWKPYIGGLDGRLVDEDSHGFLVIIPESFLSKIDEIVPIGCPLCGCLFRSNFDEEAFKAFKSCDRCALEGMKTREEALESAAKRPRQKIIVDLSQ